MFFNDKELRFRFFAILAIIFIFVYPIIHANFYYMDDYARSVYSNIGMSASGRYLSQFIIGFLNAGKHICDMAPLFQIISIFILSFSIFSISISWNFSQASSILCLPLIVCNPFFLENLSYKYDSLTMSLSVFVVCICFSYRKNAHSLCSYLLETGLILCVLNLYQPATSTFCAILGFLSLLSLEENGPRYSFSYFCRHLFSLCMGLLVYRLQISILRHDDVYYRNHSSISIDFQNILSNFHNFTLIAFKEFGLNGKGYEIFLGIILFIGFFNFNIRNFKKYKLYGVIASVCFCIWVLFSLSGFLLFLKHPTFNMRVMMSNGVILCMALTFFLGRNFEYRGFSPKLIVTGCVLFIQIAISFEWANAMKAQTMLNERVSADILEDVFVYSGNRDVYIRFISSAPISSQAQAIWDERRAIFNDGAEASVYGWAEVAEGARANEHLIMGEDEVENDKFSLESSRNMKKNCDFQYLKIGRYYNFYADQRKILIDFSHACSQPLSDK